jgi:hypothetical protein
MKFIISCLLVGATVLSGFAGMGNNAGFHYISSYHDQRQQYGRWELRMKINGGPGVINAFCLLHDTQEGDWSELDFEMSGGSPHIVEATAHMWNNRAFTERPKLWQPIHFANSLADDYHTYTIEWAPGHMMWAVDGILIRYDELTDEGLRAKTYNMQTEDDTTDLERDEILASEFDYLTYFQARPMRLAFDVWWCGDANWCGADNGTAAPSAMYCSWFKNYDYTPKNGDEGTDFTLTDWDNFDGQLTANWAEVYAVQLQEGKGVCCLNFNNGGVLGEPVPYDEGDTAADLPSEYWLPQPVHNKNVGLITKEGSSLKYGNNSIEYRVEKAGMVNISLLNMNGRTIKTLENSVKNTGKYSISLNTESIPAGAYFLTFNSPGFKQTKRLINISK